MAWGKLLLLGGISRELICQTIELNERRQVYNQAREYADSVSKPLLVVGVPKFGFNHPYGDVTIDISPNIPAPYDYEIADVREIPYPKKYFGAAHVSHILEHLPTIDDACQALDELERVADRVFVVSPHKHSLMAWINPNHHLWVTPSGSGYIIEQRGNGIPKEESYIIAMGVV